jgi:hypothetical protein
MDEPAEKPPRYKWPWIAAAVVMLGIVLAVIWMTAAAKKIERESDWSTPMTGGSTNH